MSKITLTKEIKIRLLNAIKAGEIDTDKFPEFTLDAPQEIDVKTLTTGQLNSPDLWTSRKGFSCKYRGREKISKQLRYRPGFSGTL